MSASEEPDLAEAPASAGEAPAAKQPPAPVSAKEDAAAEVQPLSEGMTKLERLSEGITKVQEAVRQHKKGAQNITVAVRLRPLTTQERSRNAYPTIKVLDEEHVLVSDPDDKMGGEPHRSLAGCACPSLTPGRVGHLPQVSTTCASTRPRRSTTALTIPSVRTAGRARFTKRRRRCSCQRSSRATTDAVLPTAQVRLAAYASGDLPSHFHCVPSPHCAPTPETPYSVRCTAGAGKTFTMMGNLEQSGVIPLTLEDLMLLIGADACVPPSTGAGPASPLLRPAMGFRAAVCSCSPGLRPLNVCPEPWV